ncbi:MAK10-like protein [Tanacetum coccineum]
MHIFIGCFVYVVDFMILEDLGSIIDSGLSEVVLGKPFARTSKLTYDESLGLASNWLECLPAGSITTWEDLTTRFLAQFIPPERTAKLRNKNTNKSWEIIENLAFYDHEGWDETKEFVKPVKAISTPQGVSKTPDEDFSSSKTRLTSY